MGRLHQLALIGLLLLCLSPGQLCETCAVNEEQRPLVTSLLNTMIQSNDGSAIPNPNVLLALRLARDHSRTTEKTLLAQLVENAKDNGTSMTSGKLALHVLALKAACQEPRVVFSSGSNLINLLEKKFQEELANIKKTGNPLTNFFQLSLDVMALCLLKGDYSPSKIANLFSPGWEKYTFGSQFSVDTGAVAVLAQICVQRINKDEKIEKNIRQLTEKILESEDRSGIIGNLYSTGLAMQALSVSGDYYENKDWDCNLSLRRMLKEIPLGTFKQPTAAAQLIPALEGKTYLDVTRGCCDSDPDNLTLSSPSPTAPTNPSTITVTYKVTDGISNTFADSIVVSVPQGSVFLKVMEAARDQDQTRFGFTQKPSDWGPYITSVRGLKADNNQRTYWQLLSGDEPLSQGAGNYVVSDGEILEVKFTNY
ncbi:transcobalamin-1 [Ornithorhynchus anatinus]|uniref:Transcobalamin-like C-terminal domain-containing protein n=1 Tax=Ornithorhynchus anatinus TaxID=9258 RepID=F6U678_ORNAN|nr:transcobalamin-1 [Ornithorhynchus anatinus]